MRIFYKVSLLFIFSLIFFQNATQAQIFEKLNGPYGGGGKVYEGRNGVLFQIYDDPYGKKNVYKSINDGGFWNKVSLVPATLEYDIVSVGLDGNLLSTHGDKLYKSINDGLSWNAINPPASQITAINSLPDGTLLAASYNQVYQSGNGGQSWIASNVSGIIGFFYNGLSNTVYALGNSSIYKSSDKGLTWTLFYSDDFGAADHDFIVATNGTLLVSGIGYIWKIDSTGTIVKKLDPGTTGYSYEIALSTVTGRLFANKIGDHSFYSDDLGDTWVNLGPGNKIIEKFATTKSGSVFGKSATVSLFKSSDNGKTWTFSAFGLNDAAISDVDFITDTRIVASTPDGLFYSGDDGKNWNLLLESKFVASRLKNKLIQHNGEEIFYADYHAIYYFKDWRSQPVLIRSKSNNRGIDKIFYNSMNGSLFSVESNGLYRSEDKGKSWTSISPLFFYDLYLFLDQSMIATASNGIYKSTDNGNNWNLVYPFNAQLYDIPIVGNSYSSAYILALINGLPYTVISTNDYGATWSAKKVRDPGSNLINPDYGFACNNLDYLYVSGVNDNEIYKSGDFGNFFSAYNDEIKSNSNLEFSPNQKLYVLTFFTGLYRGFVSTSAEKILTGHVFKDSNKDCINALSEPDLGNRLVEGINGNLKQYSYTNSKGIFTMPLINGNYDIHLVPNNNYWSTCNKAVSTATYNFKDTLQLGLQVSSVCPFMTVSMQTTILRRCREAIIYIDFSNTGTQKANSASIDVTLDPLFDFVSSSIPFISQNGNVYRFLLGDVDQNASGYFSIKVNVSCKASMGQIHCAEAHIYPDSPCVHSARAIVRTTANCLGDSIELIIRNDGNQNMAVTKNWWVVDLSNSNNNIQSFDGGSFYLNAGQVFTKRIASRARVLFVAEQDDSYPYNKSSKTEINSCSQNPLPGSPPLSISNVDDDEPFISKFCERNRGSFDPNEITGYPDGITSQRYIDNSQELEYVIRFQNTGTDTAFNVRIENQIPTTELDLVTLTLGASSHPYQFILDPNGKLIFSFSNILLPDSSINESTSHGFVQYSIKPIKQLSNGTKILNDALIYFDYNAGVNTNTDLHTIGSPIPVKVGNVGQSSEIDFQIVPNPMQEFSSVFINAKSKNEHYKLSCLDVYSKLMWEMHLTSNRASISKGELKAGVYFLVLKSADGLPIKSRKFIVE